jgi:N-acetylglucosaminyl-diphospho-decaprenol L-rhamnosyltransferase
MSDPRLAVVVVTYSPGDVLRRFVASLDETDPGQLLVISDNGSTDGVPQAVAAERSHTLLLVDDSNPGYGAAVNAAVTALPGDVDRILICNPDLVLAPGAIERLSAALDEDSTAGAVGPRILNADGTAYPSARRLPSFRDGIGHAVLGRRWPGNPWTRRYLRADVVLVDHPVQAGWLSGACLLVRRSAFEQIGGFDPGFFMYFEDVDLGKRLGEAGWANVLRPEAEVMHTGGTTTSRYHSRMLRAHHDSTYRYLRKKYPQPWMRPALWLTRAGLEARLALELRRAARGR